MIGRKSPPPSKEEQSLRGFDDFDLTLGDVLRGERATLGKSLLDVQRELKIKANYIAAIESADASAFETPGFIAGYVRSYARYLGINPDWAFDKFCAESDFSGAKGLAAEASFGPRGTVSPAMKPAAAAARTTRDPLIDTKAPFVPQGQSVLAGVEPGALGSVMVLLLLITGLIYGGWVVLRQVQQVNVVPVDEAPVVAAQLDPLSGAMTMSQNMAQGEDGVSAAPSALDRLYRPEALDVPVLVARDGPIAELDPESVGTLARTRNPRLLTQAPDTPMAMASVDTPASVGEPGDGVRVLADAAPGVELFAVRPAWVRVTAVDGSVVFEKILDAGERYVLPRTAEAPELRAGNSGSVYFLVDGRTFGPAGPGTSVAKGVKLGVDEITGAYAIADLNQDEDLAKAVAALAAE